MESDESNVNQYFEPQPLTATTTMPPPTEAMLRSMRDTELLGEAYALLDLFVARVGEARLAKAMGIDTPQYVTTAVRNNLVCEVDGVYGLYRLYRLDADGAGEVVVVPLREGLVSELNGAWGRKRLMAAAADKLARLRERLAVAEAALRADRTIADGMVDKLRGDLLTAADLVKQRLQADY